MSTIPLDHDTKQLLGALQSDYDATTPDAHVIATQIMYGKARKGQPIPKGVDLARAITGIAYDHTTGAAGSPTLTLTLADPRWQLLTTFFPTDDTGRLLDVDVNYPDKSRWWWRLHQVSPQSDYTIQLVFVPRLVGELMGLFGPISANRAKRTRAQFLKMLCLKVSDPQGVEFYSRELDIVEPIANSGPKVSTTSTHKIFKHHSAAKLVGVGSNRKHLQVKGAAMTTVQSQTANIILQVGDQLNAPRNALVAAIYAAMGESDLGADKGSAGVFQTTGDPSAYSGGSDTAAQTKGWFTGGTSFAASGIKLANQGVAPWQIANMVELNAAWLYHKQDSYGPQFPGGQAQGLAEAAAIVDGGGGQATLGSSTSISGTIDVAEPYYFTINRHEDYWTGMNRLAQEVNWELIVDGNRMYYDSDRTLIRQKIAGVIDRDDRTTLAWNYDWENRFVATNFQLEIACDLFEFSAGEVLQVHGFGPASSGSTAKLPGRWLIDEIQHNAGDIFSTFSLVQPSAAKAEPAPQMTTKTIKTSGGSVGASVGSLKSEQPRTSRAVFAAAKYLSSLDLVYTTGMRTLVKKGYAHGATALDCSASTWWCMLAAGWLRGRRRLGRVRPEKVDWRCCRGRAKS